jgi:hypothetical protein
LIEHCEPECFGVFATELKHVTDLDAAANVKFRAAFRTWVAVTHIGSVNNAVA